MNIKTASIIEISTNEKQPFRCFLFLMSEI